MRAGRLDKRISILRNTPTQHISGDQIDSWAILHRYRWAARKPLAGNERNLAPALVAMEQVDFEIRWSPDVADISPLDRIVYPPISLSDPIPSEHTRDVYEILSVIEIGRREGLRLVTVRRQDFLPQIGISLNNLTLNAGYINEGSAPGTIVGQLQGITTGSILSLIGNAGGRFALSGINIVAGLVPTDYETDTTHPITVREIHADSINSPRDSIISITVIDIDEVAPNLSNPTGMADSTTADISVSTDEDDGTLYWVVTHSSAQPSAAQIEAGENHVGAPAVASGNQAVTAIGVQNIEVSGLTLATTYYAHFMHKDALGNRSAVASSSSFTTFAAVPDAFVISDWDADPSDEEVDITINSLPAANGAAITDIEYRLNGGSWVSSGGITSFAITGLTNDQQYDVELRAVNSVGAGAASDTKQVTPTDGGAWTPLALGSKLKAWWDHSDTSTLWKDTSATVAVTSDTDVVARVNDKSGNGKHKLQATISSRPVYRNDGGLARLSYDGINDYLEISAPEFPMSSLEIFWVWRAPTTSGEFPSGFFFGFGQADIDPQWGSKLNTLVAGISGWSETGMDIQAISRTDGGDPQFSLVIGATEGIVYRTDLIIDSGIATLTRNGGASASDNSIPIFSSIHTGPFREGAAGAWDGDPTGYTLADICEIVIASSLTEDERVAVRDYLDVKWL